MECGKDGNPGESLEPGGDLSCGAGCALGPEGRTPRAKLLPSTPITFLAEGYLKEGGWGKGGRLGDGKVAPCFVKGCPQHPRMKEFKGISPQRLGPKAMRSLIRELESWAQSHTLQKDRTPQCSLRSCIQRLHLR